MGNNRETQRGEDSKTAVPGPGGGSDKGEDRRDNPTVGELHKVYETVRNRNKELKQQQREFDQYKQDLGALFLMRRKLFKRHQELVRFKEPVMLLERSDGHIEFIENKKGVLSGKEYKVQGLPEGIEKTIYLGKHYLKEFDYAGKTFRGYIAHEDYAFPLSWDEKKAVNINSETLRDVVRKVLIAWERFRARAENEKWRAIKGIIMILGIVFIAYFLVMHFFPPVKDAATLAQNLSDMANATITIIR